MSARRVQRSNVTDELSNIAAEIIKQLSTSKRHVTRPAASSKMEVGTFHEAVKHGDVQTVRRGLEGGLQDGFQLKDFKNHVKIGGIDQTPLHLASMFGHAEVAELLIQYGDDLEARDLIGQWTPLHLAAIYGHTLTCEVLIRSGANIMSRDRCLGTPLHKAAVHGNIGICELLIRSGADIKAQNEDGKNSLDVAFNRKTRKFLMKSAGVKPSICNLS
ncbi:TNKS2 [Branchiostoma lanceolatum]|uniref:TNKS2 protein n=1 Tax=Branchiostoma lanceolatum TaxID=7740 RepID=A0A8K0EY00_BRALA|nr:TNKS2 [Branchiostoma lanceolatum]